MKTLFIPAKAKAEVNEEKIKALKLPDNIAIAYSIQYKEIAEKIRKILSDRYKIIELVRVLGCSKIRFSKETRAILLISSGEFHAISLAHETKLPIYILYTDVFRKVSEEEIDAFEKRKKTSYLKFLNSEKVGILISLKPGQENLKKAIDIKNNLKDKKSYLFLSNEIDVGQFENFSEIGSWINTACPRLDMDSSVINSSDLEKK